MAGTFSKWMTWLGFVALATQTVAQENTARATLNVGTPLVVEAPSGDGEYAVVFEDDGETGYFYALEFSSRDNPIQEAIHIYDVSSVKDRDVPSVIKIAWSADQRKAGLWINDAAHTVFDFSTRRGYSRSNFPLPLKWKTHDFAWDDAALDLFR